MNRLRTVATELLGLFVDSAVEAVGIVLTVIVAIVFSRTVHGNWIGYALALVLAAVLVASVVRDARRGRG